MKQTMCRVVASLLLLTMLLLSAGCGSVGGGKDDTRKVLTLDGIKVIADTYRYFYLTYGMECAAAAEYAYAPADHAQDLQAFTERSLRTHYAVYSLAEEYDFSLSRKDAEEIDVQMSDLIAYIGDEETYFAWCTERYMTGDLFRMLSYDVNYLQSGLYEKLVADGVFADDRETVLADIAANFYHCAQIHIPHSAIAKKQAESIHADILAGGKSFTEYARMYAGLSEATTVEEATAGRYYTKGETYAAFETATRSLAVGEMSDVVETEIGYHIILRQPMNDSEIEAQYENLKSLYLQRMFTELLETRAAEMELQYARNYDAVYADLEAELSSLIAQAKEKATTTTGGAF